MTASGICHTCGKAATNFHYRRPLEVAGFHDGFWHCADHGPEPRAGVPLDSVHPQHDDLAGLNRRDRRALERKINKAGRKR